MPQEWRRGEGPPPGPCRHAKHLYEQQHRELRKRQKRAIDVELETTDLLLEWPEERAFSKVALWQQIDESKFRGSLADLRTFKRLEERGYGDSLLARYPVSANTSPRFCTYPLPPSRVRHVPLHVKIISFLKWAPSKLTMIALPLAS
jgi:hypothetical protein